MKQHYIHFIILAAMIGAGVLGFFFTQGNPGLQFFIGILTSLAYVAWGLLHHAIQKDLHPKVVIEYVLIGAIAVVLLMLLYES